MKKKMYLIRCNSRYYESTVGLSQSKEIRTFLPFLYESFRFSQIIGHLLSDGSLSMSWSNINPYFVFTQSFSRFQYTWFVFNNINFLCKSMSRLGKCNRNNKISYYLQVRTRSSSFLKEIYKNNTSIKILLIKSC